MRLIRIVSQEDSYVVHAEADIKILGVKLFSRRKTYLKAHDSTNWYEVSSSSKVSRFEEKKLNKWISDHERFIMTSRKN